MSDKLKLMERFRRVFKDGSNLNSFMISINVTFYSFILSIVHEGAAQYPNNSKIQEYAAKNLKTMDSFPDESEKILNSPQMKQRMLEAEKKIKNLKRLEKKKPTK